MAEFVPWNSRPLEEWAAKHAPGKFVDLDGLSTHYVEKGTGDPLILIHGFFFDTHMWSKNIDVFAEHFKVYALDLWGFGYSSREPLDYGYPLYADQLLKFMDALDLPKASLMGQSMGGGTIINFTISNRERVEKIVLVDPAGMPNKLPIMGRISNLPGVGELMYRLGSNFIRKFSLETTFLHNKAALTEELYGDLTRFHKIEGTSEASLYVTRKQFFDTLLKEIKSLSTMDVPILIVWGREEKSIPLSVGRKMHEILKDARFEVVDQAGHCHNIDQCDHFNQVVLHFLTSS